MKIPISWLKDYVDFDDSIDGLAAKLTFSGAEVEGIETIGGELDGLIVGEITAIEKHPNADRLSVCMVSDGEQDVQVVCGAPNCAVGGKHPFAPLGSVLPGDFKIKKAKLRGVDSFGMLCAADELGLSEEHSGLMVLDPTCSPGTPLAEILGPPEVVIDLEITPNRPDCLSMIGIAREVAALYGTELRLPDVDFSEIETSVGELAVAELADSKACPRYTVRAMRDVAIGPAPEWMRRRLGLAGVRSINNIVDITNYVMLECGQPLHAFDRDLLADNRIIVRTANPGEKMTTLDAQERNLDEDMLVIADAEKPVAIAGVMGGATSEINERTVSVLLESACFDPASVRRTSKALGLASESSYRFARSVDCGGVEWASRRAASLLAQLADAKIAKGAIDLYPDPQPPREVECSTDSIAKLLGIDIATDDLLKCFESIELEIAESDSDKCRVRIPSFRPDLEREVDLAEEYARLFGLDNIPDAPPYARVVPDASDKQDQAKAECRRNLIGLGLRETMNYSLLSPELLDEFGIDDPDSRIILPHPISSDQSVLRTTLIPQMLESLGRNHARQIQQAAFFEFGRVFFAKADGSNGEEDRISIGLMGPCGRTGLDRFKPVGPEESFLWLKGLVSNLCERQRVCSAEFTPTETPAFMPGFAVEISIEGRAIGTLGIIKSAIGGKWRIQEPIAAAELRVEPLIESVGAIRRYSEISTQPAIERDVALVAKRDLKHENIMAVVEKAAPDLLEKVDLFDIFTGKGIPEDSKSMAYAFTYRAAERTLTDEEANQYHDKIKSALRAELDVQIRD